MRIRSSRIPRSSKRGSTRSLEDFDYTFQPSIPREQIESLDELGFVERRENVIFLGPPGVGKTHLAIGLAIACAQSGRRVYYGTLADLIANLEEAQTAGRLQQRLKVLTHPALLVVDEIGYLPVSRTGAMVFFQLMSRRYERASTVLTSNKPFEEWGDILGDEVMAAALIDRLLPSSTSGATATACGSTRTSGRRCTQPPISHRPTLAHAPVGARRSRRPEVRHRRRKWDTFIRRLWDIFSRR